MVGWHHQLNRQEFEQAPGDGEGQGSLACCSPWGCQESDTTEQLNNNSNTSLTVHFIELISSGKENKSKHNTWDIIKLKSFRVAKESISKTESQPH